MSTHGEKEGKKARSLGRASKVSIPSLENCSELTSSRSITEGSLQRETNRCQSLASRVVNVQRVGGTIRKLKIRNADE
jgi:hypothetical protein